MSDWYKKVNEHHDIIENCSYRLDIICNALYQTGNENLAKRIANISDDIRDNLAGINDAVGQNIDEQLKRSQEATANMINACLAVGKDKKDGPD